MIKPLAINANKFFSQGHERSIKLKRNIAASFVLRMGSILIAFIAVPVTINYVEPTKYGIWITLSSVVGWLGFFDIGFGNGLRNKFAEAVTRGEHQLARIYLSTTYAILSIIIGVILVIFLCINPFLNWSEILNAPSGMSDELSKLALIVFAFFSIQFILQLITIIVSANQQPAKASLINFVGSLFSLLIVLILRNISPGNLIYLGFMTGLIPVLIFFCFFSLVIYPWI
jgi:O-antigen/teichoic acid export membrane protein